METRTIKRIKEVNEKIEEVKYVFLICTFVSKSKEELINEIKNGVCEYKMKDSKGYVANINVKDDSLEIIPEDDGGFSLDNMPHYD